MLQFIFCQLLIPSYILKTVQSRRCPSWNIEGKTQFKYTLKCEPSSKQEEKIDGESSHSWKQIDKQIDPQQVFQKIFLSLYKSEKLGRVEYVLARKGETKEICTYSVYFA